MTIPANNPWDVAGEEQSEQTGWANFDNFESTLSIDENATTDNKPKELAKEDEKKNDDTSETPTPAIPTTDKDLSLENTVEAKAIGGGDTTAIETSTESKVINNKVQSVDSVNTTDDDNANPSEIVGER